MKLKELKELVESGTSFSIYNAGFQELITDIDAEIAKAREGAPDATGVVSPSRDLAARVSLLENRVIVGMKYQNSRISALESSEIELRQHCQGNVPMSVFSDLKKRVDSLSSDISSLENQTTRELRALVERVPRLGEDDAYKAWRSEPWPDDVVKGGPGVQLEEAFRAGFRAGRK